MAMGMVMCVDEVWFLIGVLVGFIFLFFALWNQMWTFMCYFDNAIKLFTIFVVASFFFFFSMRFELTIFILYLSVFMEGKSFI